MSKIKTGSILFLNLIEKVSAARSSGYAILLRKFYRGYKQQVDKLLADRYFVRKLLKIVILFRFRKSMPLEAQEKTMTDSYCKTEFILTVANHCNIAFIVFVLFHAMVYFSPNDYQLPFNCYIIFLPPEGFLLAWELNYLIMTTTATFACIAMASFVPLPFLLMNHSCYLVDMALMTAEKVNEDLRADENIHDLTRVAKTKENLKTFVERCEKFVEWQSEVQGLLFWYFNLELQVQSLILCLSIYVLSITLSAGVIAILFTICTAQIFVLCWMGT